METEKKYLVSTGSHTGSSGFTNYFGGYADEGLKKTLQEVFNDFSNVVVIDGSDDWYAELKYSPSSLCKKFDIEPRASFHTGISGISSSGRIIDETDFDRLKETCLKLGFDITKTCRCYNKEGEIK